MKKLAMLPLFFILLFLCNCGDAEGSGQNAGDLLSQENTVKHARMKIINQDPDSVRNKIYKNISQFESSIIQEYWNDKDKVTYSGSLTIKIPSENFLPMVDWLRDEFKIKEMSLNARLPKSYDSKNGNVVDGKVYSEIYISINRDIGFGESFLIGTESAGDALKYSLQFFLPVIIFLLPYALFALLIIILVRVILMLIRKHKENKKQT